MNVGDIVNGKYLVEAIIGEGGVGVVVRAQNLELDERVALKFLRPEMLAHKEIVARFAREAKAASSIKSEYVAMVFDVGTMTNGTPYLVMEHLDGKDLSTVLYERGRLGPREAAEYAMQVCEALAVAHAKGVIHRDIKPDNLFVTSRSGMNFIKVLDFGISKTALTGSMFGNDLPIVKTVSLMGTPLYMSPEQVRSSQTVDERADIWALGMVLYEALAGVSPFKATSITELCAEILEKPVAPITTHRTDLPPGLVHVIEKCLEKDPQSRYQNVAELAMALMPLAPRRARICAERAAQALMAAGIIEEASVQIASTYPPAASDSLTATAPSFELAAPKTPSINGSPSLLVAPPSSASGTFGATGESPALGAVPAAAVSTNDLTATGSGIPRSTPVGMQLAAPTKSSRLAIVVVAVAALAAAAAIFAWVRASSSGGAVASAQAKEPAPTQVAATVTAPAITTPTTTTAGADTAPAKTETPATTTTAAATAQKPWWTQQPAKPGAPKWGAAPAKTEKKTTNNNAKKTSDEPDLGY